MGSEVAGSSEGGLTELVNSVGEEGNNGNEENEEGEVTGEVDDMGPPTGSTSNVKFKRLEIGEEEKEKKREKYYYYAFHFITYSNFLCNKFWPGVMSGKL